MSLVDSFVDGRRGAVPTWDETVLLAASEGAKAAAALEAVTLVSTVAAAVAQNIALTAPATSGEGGGHRLRRGGARCRPLTKTCGVMIEVMSAVRYSR